MELEALEIFIDVAELGNFSRAARRRNLAVSSVTRKIDQLELDFGMTLFNRSPRSMQLTDAGQQVLASAYKIVAELADTRDALQDSEAQVRGTLVVSAPATFGRRHVAPAVAAFLLRHPALEIELHVSDDMLDLNKQRIDVAIRIGQPEDSDLLATTLAPQRRVVVASPAYLARHGRPADPLALLEHNCLSVGKLARRAGWWVFAGLNDGQPLPVRGNLSTGDSESLLRAALAGVGIAHLATWLVAKDIGGGALVPLFFERTDWTPAAQSTIYALRTPGRKANKARLFIEHLKAAFSANANGAWQ